MAIKSPLSARMRPGGGGRFAAMVASGKSPALAAWIGRRKYGASQMSRWAAKGRKRGFGVKRGQ